MSRFSIAILVIIILGFVMTVKRDQPQETPTINTAVDKSKQPPQTADKKKPTQTVTPAQPPVTPVVTKEPEKVPEAPKTAEAPAVTPTTPTVKTEVAPTTPPVTPPPAIDTKILESGEALSRATQQELSRLGCFTGNVNQRWGADGREAIKRFNTSARFAWPDWPSPDLVASMQRYPADFCKKCRNGGDCSNPANPNKTQTVSVEPQKTTPEAPKTTTPPVETPKTTVAPAEPPKTTATPAEPPKVSTTSPTTPVTPTTPPSGETSSPPGNQASGVDSLPEKTEEPSYLPPSVKKRQEQSNREEQSNEEADQPTPRRNQRRVEEPSAEPPAKKVRPRYDEDNSRARAEQRYRERYERADRNDYDRPVWIRPRDEPRPRRRYERDYDDWDMRPSGGGR